MVVLLDTNVALDRLLEREPWFTDDERFWQLLDEGEITGYITATALTDIFYITRRLRGRQLAYAAVRESLAAFEVITVDRERLEDALLEPGSDFEDNLQIVCARMAGLDAIVTRDPAGFRSSSLPALTPAEVVAQLEGSGDDRR